VITADPQGENKRRFVSGHRLSDAEVSGKQSALAAVLAMFTAAKTESSLLHLRHA
jgi:hypothetical protein